MARLIKAAEGASNNLGTVVLAPTPSEPNVYRLVHRFADEGSQRAWEDSDVRRGLSAEAYELSIWRRQFQASEAPDVIPDAAQLGVSIRT